MAATVLVVDDHQGFRAMARQLLEDDGHFQVVGEAGDGEDALRQVAELRPDLVLLDVQLPDTDGFTVARRIAAVSPATVVVLTSIRPASDYGHRLPTDSARAFVPKADLSGKALLDAMAGPA